MNLSPEHLAGIGTLSDKEIELIKQKRAHDAGIEARRLYWNSLRDVQYEKWTAEILLDTIIGYCEEEAIPFVIDQDNKDTIHALMLYFTGDSRFVEFGASIGKKWSLNKGIYLFGPVGVGKSQIMRILSKANQIQLFNMVDCSDIAAGFTKKEGGGEASLEKYYTDKTIQCRDKYGREKIGYCFDDLGIESDGRYFGNTTNVMERIIECRYKKHKELITHIVSNLTTAQLKERYGIRTYDRMKEMFNIVEFPANAKSRRG